MSVEDREADMTCELCEREASADLCGYHQKAKDEVESAYRYWREAYGSLTWPDYLNRIIRNGETGEWASEVAKMMLAAHRTHESGTPDFKS